LNQKSTIIVKGSVHQVTIESLTQDSRGVCHIDGKAVFVSDVLPGEELKVRIVRNKRRFAEADIEEMLQASPKRVEPPCRYFGLCGGCGLQHLHSDEQLASKEQVLLEQLEHIGHVKPQSVLPMMRGETLGYRRKARVGVKYVIKKERVLVGFRERKSPFIADMEACLVLHPLVGQRLTVLRDLIADLSIFDAIPQVEVAVADKVALVFRHLKDLSLEDEQKLAAFAQQQRVEVYLQSAGPDSIVWLNPESLIKEAPPPLHYLLEDWQLRMAFQPNDFVQINFEINRKMIAQAMSLLEVTKSDRVLDLFCGLGNFSLPLARQVDQVIAVDVDQALIQRAADNAAVNQLSNVKFYAADLFLDQRQTDWWSQIAFNKVLLDPARTGAIEILPHLAAKKPERIVYVSCNPATLARDAGLLVNECGYRLVSAGVMDMFPHTHHVESMALFVRD